MQNAKNASTVYATPASRCLFGLVLVASALSTACEDNDGDERATANFSAYDAGAVPGGPGAKARYGLGAAASDSAVAAMNVDIGMTGEDLPAGHGTVAEGAALYAAQCASCHGAAGEGMPPFPRLLGRDTTAKPFQFANDTKLAHTIGNYWPYATTLFDYIKRTMPFLTPGTLSNDQVYALSAYLLAAEHIIADNATMDAAALRAVQMPSRDLFVRDDRKPNATGK